MASVQTTLAKLLKMKVAIAPNPPGDNELWFAVIGLSRICLEATRPIPFHDLPLLQFLVVLALAISSLMQFPLPIPD